MNSDSKPTGRMLYAALVALIWWPAIFLTLFSYSEYAEKFLLQAYARSIGLGNGAELSVTQYLLIFSKAALVPGILIPAITFFVAYHWRSRGLAVLVAVLSIAVLTLSFTNLLAVANTGSLMTWSLLKDSAVTASKQPQLATAYVSTSSLIKFALFLFLIVFSGYLAIRSLRSRYSQAQHKTLLVVSLLVLSVVPGLYAFTRISNAAAAEPGVSFLTKQIRTFLEIHQEQASVFEGLGMREATAIFRDMVDAPEFDSRDALFGAAEGSNLILVALETAPAQVLQLSSLDRFETLHELSKTAIVSEHHYSTYPYTSDALFSLLSSLYPNELRRNLFDQALPARSLNSGGYRLGLFNALADAGYRVKMFLPYEPLFESDGNMFTALGASDFFYPNEQAVNSAELQAAVTDATDVLDGYAQVSEEQKAFFQTLLGRDLVALTELLAEIRTSPQTGEPFAFVFLPQLGHGPWPDLAPFSTLTETGSDIFQLHDQWLGDIVHALENNSLADETMIVVTADHGLRTSAEYPALRPGTLNDISFRVPLLIHAPTLPDTTEVTHVSSHIDVAPSILSLLGIEPTDMYMLGSPVWDPRLEGRLTYLLGKSYLGVDGYYQDGAFSMYHELSRSVQRVPRLHGQGDNQATGTLSAEEIAHIRQTLDTQRSFQRLLNRHFLKSGEQR